jgi:hypothetical protein
MPQPSSSLKNRTARNAGDSISGALIAGGAGVSGYGVGGISVSSSSTVDAGGAGKEVTDMLQPERTTANVQTIKLNLKFIQNVSFSPIQTMQRH